MNSEAVKPCMNNVAQIKGFALITSRLSLMARLPANLPQRWRAMLARLASAAPLVERQSPWRIFSLAVLACLLISYLDTLTGWAFSLSVLYAVPIAFAAWFAGGRFGIALALLAGVCWAIANHRAHPYGTQVLYGWAACTRTVYFLVTAVGAWALRRQANEFQARLDAILRANELEREIARVGEEEKRRIGQELHDGMCQTLSAIDCAVGCLEVDLEEDLESARRSTRAIQEMLKSATLEARRLARGLFPLDLGTSGLSQALEELVGRLAASYRIPIATEVDETVAIEDAAVALNLYRIAQEALSNALRHAGATQLTLSLKSEDAALVLTVQDNGRGMGDPDGKKAGMGLETMCHRAKSIGGTLQVESTPGGGTTVRCRVGALTT
jgi:signal transduction histidine kinase